MQGDRRHLALLKASGVPYVIRVPLIPGINDDRAHLEQVVALAGEKRGNLVRIDFMPYNPFAAAKYEMAGMPFAYEKKRDNDLSQIPKAFLEAENIPFEIL